MSFIFSFVSYMLATVKGGIMYFLAPKQLQTWLVYNLHDTENTGLLI